MDSAEAVLVHRQWTNALSTRSISVVFSYMGPLVMSNQGEYPPVAWCTALSGADCSVQGFAHLLYRHPHYTGFHTLFLLHK